MRSLLDDCCRVTEDGVDHLFVGVDYGAVCSCGRMFLAFAVNDEEPHLYDVRRETPSPRLLSAACARYRAVARPQIWKVDLLLARGEAEIRRARRGRGRAEEVVTSAQRAVGTARQLWHDGRRGRAG